MLLPKIRKARRVLKICVWKYHKPKETSIWRDRTSIRREFQVVRRKFGTFFPSRLSVIHGRWLRSRNAMQKAWAEKLSNWLGLLAVLATQEKQTGPQGAPRRKGSMKHISASFDIPEGLYLNVNMNWTDQTDKTCDPTSQSLIVMRWTTPILTGPC